MKRDMDKLNLRDAFPEMPDACRDALTRAARSVKEEEKMKRATLRTFVIAALIVAAMTAVALAAGSIFGWSDFYSQMMGTPSIPQKAQDVLSATEAQEFTVGNIRFTLRELLCDGYIAMSSTVAQTADGSPAVIVMEPFDALGAIGENGAAYAKKLGVDSQTSGIDAARTLGLPLYSVRAILEVEPDQFKGERMEEGMWDENGDMVYFSLIDDLIPGNLNGDTLHAKLFLRVAEYNTETSAETSREAIRVDIALPISESLGERDYLPEGDLTANGLTLVKAHAVHTVAGVYLETFFTAAEGVTLDAFYDLPENGYVDTQGRDYGFGMNLGTPQDVRGWPDVSMTFLISVDELPESLVFYVGDQQVTLK